MNHTVPEIEEEEATEEMAEFLTMVHALNRETEQVHATHQQ